MLLFENIIAGNALSHLTVLIHSLGVNLKAIKLSRDQKLKGLLDSEKFLVNGYFLQLKTVLIVHNSSDSSRLQLEYLKNVEWAFSNGSEHSHLSTTFIWLDVAFYTQNKFQQQMLRSVDFGIEGFITILPNTSEFLHARYYATRNSKLRLKDKYYLFLCGKNEDPKIFLSSELLQFYPRHLMIAPKSTQRRNELKNNDHQFLDNQKRAGNSKSNSIANNFWFQEINNSLNFDLWTQKFVGASNNFDAILLNTFFVNKTFVKEVELYPNKLLNLMGRTIKTGTLTYIPYSVAKHVKPGLGNTDPPHDNEPNLTVSWIGSEPELMRAFCRVRNCRIRVKSYGRDNWGAIFENGSSFGVLGGIYTQRVEVALGCLYDWYGNLTDTSHTIARSSVTILGPAPALTPRWDTNIAPFSLHLWMFVLVTMIICSASLYLIRATYFHMESLHLRNNKKNKQLQIFRKSALDILAIFLQQSVGMNRTKRFAFRLLMAFLLIATITLENTYSGQLKSILLIPTYTDPVDTSDKWVKSDYIWAAPVVLWIESLQGSSLLKDKLVRESFRAYDYETLYKLSFSYQYGLAVERLQSGSFSFAKYITAKAMHTKITLKDDLYFDYTRAIAIRGWPLMSLFNSHVRICMESGLFEQWERISVRTFMDRKTQDMMIDSVSGFQSDDELKALNTANIAGALLSLIIGYILAVTAFVLEISGPKLKKIFLKIKSCV